MNDGFFFKKKKGNRKFEPGSGGGRVVQEKVTGRRVWRGTLGGGEDAPRGNNATPLPRSQLPGGGGHAGAVCAAHRLGKTLGAAGHGAHPGRYPRGRRAFWYGTVAFAYVPICTRRHQRATNTPKHLSTESRRRWRAFRTRAMSPPSLAKSRCGSAALGGQGGQLVSQTGAAPLQRPAGGPRARPSKQNNKRGRTPSV